METGERIKLIREEKKLELSQVADRTKITEEHLANIEAGSVAPALGTLIKLARALGVRPGTFLDDIQDKGVVVTRSTHNKNTLNMAASGTGVRDNLSFLSLAQEKSDRHMDPFLIEVSPDAPLHSTLSSHEGEEFIYVLEGAIEVMYGKETFVLQKGDSMYYDSVIGHQVKASQKALILAIVYLPL